MTTANKLKRQSLKWLSLRTYMLTFKALGRPVHWDVVDKWGAVTKGSSVALKAAGVVALDRMYG